MTSQSSYAYSLGPSATMKLGWMSTYLQHVTLVSSQLIVLIMCTLKTYHGLDELHAVVLGRVMRCRDHDTNPFSLERARPKGRNEPHACQHRIEDKTAVVSHVLETGARATGDGRPFQVVPAKGPTHALVRN